MGGVAPRKQLATRAARKTGATCGGGTMPARFEGEWDEEDDVDEDEVDDEGDGRGGSGCAPPQPTPLAPFVPLQAWEPREAAPGPCNRRRGFLSC